MTYQKKLIGTVLIVAILAALYLVLSSDLSMQQQSSSELNSSQNIVQADGVYRFDPSDTRALANNTDRIFVGKILAQADNYSFDSFTYPAFTVNVITNIKGEAPKQVTLVQGDVFYRDGQLYVIDGDNAHSASKEDVLLKPGYTYVFATRFDSKNNLYEISIRNYDRNRISIDSSLSDRELSSVATQDARVKEFQSVVSEQTSR